MYGLTSLAVLAAGALSVANARPHPIPPVRDFFYSPNQPSLLPAVTAEATSSHFPQYTGEGQVKEAYPTAPNGYRASGFGPTETQTFKSPHFPPKSGYGTAYGTAGPYATGYGSAHGTAHGTAYRPTGVSAYSTGLSGTAVATQTPTPKMIRGVNLGGWLILEKWMTPDLFEGTDATDQWSFDQTEGAEKNLQQHWDTYITENDIKKLSAWGINAVRIPIGYWAYKTYDSGYLQGADEYLERAIGWCRSAGIKVMVDCHGSVGSQNGFDNSGRNGTVEWQSKATTDGTTNMEKSIEVLKIMAEKYGSMQYADVVYAFEMVNEPISWDQNNFNTTKEWAQDAYNAVRLVAENKDMMVVMHDGFMKPREWVEVGEAINGADTPLEDSRFAMDVHLYQNQDKEFSKLNQHEHIAAACNWTNSQLLPASSNLPVYVGEFSTQTNICANPDGSTLAGSVCTTEGCQCSSNVDPQYWSEPLIAATRKFVEAELDAFEHSSQGWFIWTYKGPGAWGLDNAIKYGLIGKTVTERKYENQCKFSS